MLQEILSQELDALDMEETEGVVIGESGEIVSGGVGCRSASCAGACPSTTEEE